MKWIGVGGAVALAGAEAHSRFLVRFGVVALLLSATVLERFGVNVGPLSTSVALLAGYGFLALAALAGALSLSLERCLLFAICLTVGLSSLLVNEGPSSPPSLALLAAMYFPFIFVLKPGAVSTTGDSAWVMDRFLNIALFCAGCGIAQFTLQSVVHADWLMDFTRYIPEKLRASGTFNTVIPMGSFNKSNGFFFREPSGFSLVMAMALIGEAFTRRRTPRLAVLGIALLLTYSGTGLLALLLGTLYPLGPKTLLRLGAIALAGAIVFWLLGDVLNLSFTLGRVSEFNSTYSSGYMRYIAPGRLVSESIDSSGWAPWLGHGPGTIFRTVRDYEFHDPTWAKLLFEYGVLGFAAFGALFLVTLRRPGVPLQVRAAMFWGWLIMGGHLLSPELNFLALALIGFAPSSSATREQADAAPVALIVPAG